MFRITIGGRFYHQKGRRLFVNSRAGSIFWVADESGGGDNRFGDNNHNDRNPTLISRLSHMDTYQSARRRVIRFWRDPLYGTAFSIGAAFSITVLPVTLFRP